MNIQKAIQSAFQYQQKGNFEQAEVLCRKILKKKPKCFDALQVLGFIQYQKKDYESSIHYLKKALELNHTNAHVYNNLGNSYQMNENYDEAIECYQKAIKINPHYDEAYNNIGRIFYVQEKFDDAMGYFRKALNLNPNYEEAYSNLGSIYTSMERMDDAVSCYQKAVQINPNNSGAYRNLGIILQDEGLLDEAKACYQRAIHLNPADGAAYARLSQLSHLEGERFSVEKSILFDHWTSEFTFPIQVDNEKRLLYLEIAKAGSTAVKFELFWKPLFGIQMHEEIRKKRNPILGYHFTKTLEPYRDFFKFTVVRDPYTRFMSAYFHLIHKQYRDEGNYAAIKNLGIEDWPDEIVNDPNKFLHHVNKEILNRERHTALQTYLLPKDLNDLDYIGQLENMKEVGEKLSHICNCEIKFDKIYFKGPSTRDYYSYKIDVDRFNELFMEDYKILNKFYKPLNGSLFSA